MLLSIMESNCLGRTPSAGLRPGVKGTAQHNRGYSEHTDEAVVLLPLGLVHLDELEEDDEHERPEAGQTGVVDDVEDGDEGPGLGGPPNDGARVLVIKEPLDGLEAVSLHGFDGCAANWHGVLSSHDDQE